MTLTDTAAPASIPAVSAEERAERLTSAGTAWSERIQNAPSSANLTYTVTGEGTGSVASTITAGKHTFTVDEPAALAGDDIAASPVEFALGALISCQIVVYRLYAQNLGIQVDDIRATAEGNLNVKGLFGVDAAVRPGFNDVRLTITVTGPETQERYDELHAAVDAHCPVLDLFANATPVTVDVVKG
ncbi:OsmC family protein [Paramicrobacterium agarici]|uniref:Putative OsmC-like protein n=1 Tax=Paramicrobacterium agarici TaxID=630514 RepID=A0A2A9DV85_9MICO|nr:OsmC family protein [Microbacterium agarici]PFG30065.1 putative OsmC-like protein [Microbacterium agarici]